MLPNNQIQRPPQTESVVQEPLNLSSREKPRSPLHKANGRIPGWSFINSCIVHFLSLFEQEKVH